MNFWEHFFRLLPRKPLPAIAALYWRITRRKVRASNLLRLASADLPFVYAAWIRSNEKRQDVSDRHATLLETSEWLPSFCVVLHSPVSYSSEQFIRSRTSVERQIYSNWTIASAVAGFGPTIDTDADFIVPLRVGDKLSPAALFRFAETAQEVSTALILYGDEDRLDERGRRTNPWFKPRWNEEMFLALDYLSNSAAVRTRLAREIWSIKEPQDVSALMLSAGLAAADSIVHVPHVLCHVDSTAVRHSDRVSIVAEQLEPLGGTCSEGPFDTVKVEWPLPEELPLISIIIATKDKLELLRPCVEGILDRTDYGRFELLIVDNGSVEASTRSYLAKLGTVPDVRVLAFPHPFNFSAINNFAARESRGSFLCLLNNDTEVIEPSWLTELMRYAVRRDVGATGAKLLYPDSTIQHAGIVVGIGGAAGHAHRHLPATDAGYFRMAHVPQFVSAVTGACLVIEKAKFDAVGGLEEDFAVAFNDVDFCLKIQSAGWRNVYVPHAVLLHHESKSRGKDELPQNVRRFRREFDILQQRWGTNAYVDPVHNPNLDRGSERFVIGL